MSGLNMCHVWLNAFLNGKAAVGAQCCNKKSLGCHGCRRVVAGKLGCKRHVSKGRHMDRARLVHVSMLVGCACKTIRACHLGPGLPIH